VKAVAAVDLITDRGVLFRLAVARVDHGSADDCGR
jgi:hypothetical protein